MKLGYSSKNKGYEHLIRTQKVAGILNNSELVLEHNFKLRPNKEHVKIPACIYNLIIF